MTTNTQHVEPIVKLVSQELYQHLHNSTYLEPKQDALRRVYAELERNNLDIKDNSVDPGLPIPILSEPLEGWINKVIEKQYGKYFYLLEQLCELDVRDIDVPDKASHILGWSKFVDEKWVKCDGLEAEAAVFDFECFQRTKKELFYPYMLSAIGSDGIVYSWLEMNPDEFPDLVDFGSNFRLLLGHNSVAFDSQFIAQFYEDFHPYRMVDTFSLHAAVYGMSERQTKIFRKFQNKPVKPLWAKKTCVGGLKPLSKFLCDIELDKSIRDEVILQKRGKKKLNINEETDYAESGGVSKNFNDFNEIIRRIDDVWTYCLNDSFACLEVAKKLLKVVRSYKTKIYLAGQLERSIIITTVDPRFQEKIERIRRYNDTALQAIDGQIQECLERNLKAKSPELMGYIKGWLLKDYFERVWKSSKFVYKKIDEIPQEALDTELPACMELCGWEDDENDDSDNAEIKRNTIKKLKAVKYALTVLKYNPGKIKINSEYHWKKKNLKPSDDKISIPHISLAGKATPYIIGLKFNGRPVIYNKNTWGYLNTDNEFVAFMHPKGEGNVGNPLAKDFALEAKNGRLTADIDLNWFFKEVSKTVLWEKFDKRFRNVRIVKGKWKVNIRPSGTVTGRPTGELAVVLPNAKKTRAGSEPKSFCYRARKGWVKISADYEAQESEYFCVLLDSMLRSPGLAPFSVIAHCGRSDQGTDIHSYVSKCLSDYATKLIGSEFVIARQEGKAMNFANQFLGGVNRIATMLNQALKGAVDFATCVEVVKYFQQLTRGTKEGKTYYGGLASVAFNRLIELAKEPGQTCLLTGRRISTALDAKYLDPPHVPSKFIYDGIDYTVSELTTRANFTIQGGGQGLVDVCLIITRFFAEKFGIPYNFVFFVHDEIHLETFIENAQNLRYIMQMGHLFSKALLYKKAGCQGFPINKMYFGSIEQDLILRKSPEEPCVTPSQPEPPELYLVSDMEKAEFPEFAQVGNTPTLGTYKVHDCFPDERISKMLKTTVF